MHQPAEVFNLTKDHLKINLIYAGYYPTIGWMVEKRIQSAFGGYGASPHPRTAWTHSKYGIPAGPRHIPFRYQSSAGRGSIHPVTDDDVEIESPSVSLLFPFKTRTGISYQYTVHISIQLMIFGWYPNTHWLHWMMS